MREALLLLLAVVCLCAAWAWYEAEYPCLRTATECTPAHIDLQHEPDGNVSPVYVNERCQQVCVERSERAR
jgi:hypothetical protein